MNAAEKKALRARWSAELVLAINERMIRSTPKKPAWTRGEIAALFPAHDVDGTSMIDLRGFAFYELRNVTWADVDLRGSLFTKARPGPRLIGTGSLGNVASELTRCRFDAIDCGDANIGGAFVDCRFDGAKLARMDFESRARVTGTSFAGASLRKAKLTGDVVFRRCDFTNARLNGSDLAQGVTFEDCVFDGAVMDAAAIMGARFVRCSMKDVSAKRVIVEKPRFEDTTPPAFEPLA